MLKLLLHWLVAAASILIAARIVPGVFVAGWGSALVAALVLGFLNVLVKPLLIVLTLPITILTLGLFLLVLNAVMVSLAGYFVPGLTVDGFWAALFASLVISVCTAIGDRLLAGVERPRSRSERTITL